MAGQILSEENCRSDGRKASEIRRVRCQMGMFAQAHGSAFIEQGNTKVLASVYGPHEMSSKFSRSSSVLDKAGGGAVINCQFSMATFSTTERRHRPRGDRKAVEISNQLSETFQSVILTKLFPRSQIDIFVEVLQADGSHFSACVNAATLALMDASIPLSDCAIGCSASVVEGKEIVDFSRTENTGKIPGLELVILARSERIVFLHLHSKVHEEYLEKLIDAAISGCKDIFFELDNAVREHITEVAASMTNS